MRSISNLCRLGWSWLAIGILVAGCRSRSAIEFAKIPTPLPPAFLSGPAAVLLTNTAGFSAQVETRGDPLAGTTPVMRGQLLGSGSKLFFAPERDKAADKLLRAGPFFFVWDVGSGSGFVVSEALQAYAPMSSDVRATNVVQQAASQTAAGVSQLEVVQMNNGTAEAFQVVPGPERIPSRIRSLSNAVPFSVTFSKFRREKLRDDLFDPPDGFTKYSSPEAMVDEIAARQRNLRRKQPTELDQLQMLQRPPGAQ